MWSPGIPLSSPLAADLRAAGVCLVSELSFAAPDLPQSIVVTGTNGKSTVCELITAMIRASGSQVACIGNVGTPASDMALNGSHYEWVVVECSSYQLELKLDLDVQAAVLTNLAPDHLDRYPQLEDYYRVKWSIFERLHSEAGAVLPYDLTTIDRLEGRGAISGRALPDAMADVAEWQRSDALAGEAGLENLAQSVAVARFVGVNDAIMQRAAVEFSGLPHARRGSESGLVSPTSTTARRPMWLRRSQAYSELMVTWWFCWVAPVRVRIMRCWLNALKRWALRRFVSAPKRAV